MNDRLRRLQKKYDDDGSVGVVDRRRLGPDKPSVDDAQADLCAFTPGADGWRGCSSISLLRAYLDEHPELMARVGLSDGVLSLRFDPPLGLDSGDGQRLRHAVEAVELLRDAKDDILRLVEAGGMRLSKLPQSWEV